MELEVADERETDLDAWGLFDLFFLNLRRGSTVSSGLSNCRFCHEELKGG